MESDVADQRYVTWFLWKRRTGTPEIQHRLEAVCGPNAPSRATIYNWIRAFKAGKNNREDAHRSGRPFTSTNPEQVAAVRELVRDDPRMSISEVSEQVGISFGSVQTILKEELGLSKLSCRWIPKLLTNEQKQRWVEVSEALVARWQVEGREFLQQIVTGDESWFFFYEPETKAQSREWRPIGSAPPSKPRTAQSAAKRKAVIFWDSQGILLV